MFSIDIQSITFKDINELFYRGELLENQTIEIKKHFSMDRNGRAENKEFAKDVTAMVNAEGGYIFLGIDEQAGEVCGMEAKIGNQKIEDWISNVLNDLVDKTFSYTLRVVPMNEEASLVVAVLELPSGMDKPYYVTANDKSLVYMRRGTSVFSAKPTDIAEMYKVSAVKEKPSAVIIKQKLKGNNNQQIGQNFGKIYHTQKVQKITEVIYDPELYIDDQQAKAILDKVNEIVDIHDAAGKFKTKESKSRFYATTWSGIKNRYKVTKYTLLPKTSLEDCLTWLQKEIASKHRPILRKHNNPKWKTEMYGSIYARAQNNLGLNKQALFDYAFKYLNLKEPIGSLKDLNDVNLKKLYTYLFST